MWKGGIYIDHCTMEGLFSTGNIQGCPADILVTIFHKKSIGPVLKWVDDFAIFCSPVSSSTNANGVIEYSYSYNLPMIMDIMDPLGVPWHPIETKGQEFGSMVSYVSFIWDLEFHSISLSPKKMLKISIQSLPFASC